MGGDVVVVRGGLDADMRGRVKEAYYSNVDGTQPWDHVGGTGDIDDMFKKLMMHLNHHKQCVGFNNPGGWHNVEKGDDGELVANYTPGTGCKGGILNQDMDILLADLFGKQEFLYGKQFPPSINVQLPGCHTPRHPDEPDWDGGGLFIVVMAAVGHGLFFFEHGSGTLHWFLLEEGDIMCFTGVVRYEYTHGVVNLQARGIRMTLTNRYGEDTEPDRVAYIKRVQRGVLKGAFKDGMPFRMYTSETLQRAFD